MKRFIEIIYFMVVPGLLTSAAISEIIAAGEVKWTKILIKSSFLFTSCIP